MEYQEYPTPTIPDTDVSPYILIYSLPFTFKSQVNTHMFSHRNNPSFFCIHPNCGKAFFNESDLTGHSKRHNSKWYQCLDCLYKDTDKRNFDSHRLSHSRIAKYKILHVVKSSYLTHRKGGISRMASAQLSILDHQHFNISCGNDSYIISKLYLLQVDCRFDFFVML